MKKNFILIILILISSNVFSEINKNNHSKEVEETKKILRDVKSKNREIQIQRLLNLEEEKAIPFLINLLQNDKDEIIRGNIAYKFKDYGKDNTVVSALLKACNDESWYVRMSAARSLLNLKKEEEAAKVLIKLLRDEDIYNEMYSDVINIKNAKVKNYIYKEVYKIAEDATSPITTRSYAITMMLFVYNKPLNSYYKKILIKTLEFAEEDDAVTIINILNVMYPRDENSGLTKEDCLEILRTAVSSKHIFIKKKAQSVIDNILHNKKEEQNCSY